VLYHLCQGLSNKAIARQMGIGEGTVRKSYVSELLRFFAVSRRTELMIEVSRRQLRLTVPGR
jgi:DNA-binding NarL/FixJ family response regulator